MALNTKNTVETVYEFLHDKSSFVDFRTYECMSVFYTFGNVCKQFFAFIPSRLHFTVDTEEEEG